MTIHIPEWLLWIGGGIFAVIGLALMLLGAFFFKILWDASR
jgi:hypothetical protein